MSTTITNKHNLPEVFVRAAQVDRHRVNGDLSVTQLIDAPQIRQLRKKHDLESDVMDRIWMMWGTSFHRTMELADIDSHEAKILIQAIELYEHLGLEKAAAYGKKVLEKYYPDGVNEDVITELTLTVDILDYTLSGTCDRLVKSEKKIQDYKTTGVFAFNDAVQYKKWEDQLNIYAYMYEMIGIEVDHIEVLAIFKNWTKAQSKTNKSYPPSPVMAIPLKRRTNEEIKTYLENRVRLHKAADNGEDIPCTPKDMWSEPTTYAVKKKGGKRAFKVFPQELKEEAYKMVEENKGKFPPSQSYEVEVRPGGNRRCDDYCSVSEVCPQRKAFLESIQDKGM